jgi:hypothetical protein
MQQQSSQRPRRTIRAPTRFTYAKFYDPKDDAEEYLKRKLGDERYNEMPAAKRNKTIEHLLRGSVESNDSSSNSNSSDDDGAPTPMLLSSDSDSDSAMENEDGGEDLVGFVVSDNDSVKEDEDYGDEIECVVDEGEFAMTESDEELESAVEAEEEAEESAEEEEEEEQQQQQQQQQEDVMGVVPLNDESQPPLAEEDDAFNDFIVMENDGVGETSLTSTVVEPPPQGFLASFFK